MSDRESGRGNGRDWSAGRVSSISSQRNKRLCSQTQLEKVGLQLVESDLE